MQFKGISYLELLQPFCSVECIYLCNFGRGYYEEQFFEIQGLDNDHGQTDSQARAQRLSRARQKVTWLMLIGVTNFHHQTKQRLPV